MYSGILFFLFMILSASAFAAEEIAQSFTLDGRLYDTATPTNPLLDSGTFQIQILSQDSLCILYEEQQPFNTTASNGYFNVQVGTPVGSGLRTASDRANTMARVYSNTGADIDGKLATDGVTNCTYDAASGHVRKVRVKVTPSDLVVRTLSPDMTLDSVPTAVVAESAESVQGLARANILELNTVVPLTQANVENIFSAVNYPILTGLIAGTNSNYVQTDANGAELPTFAADPGTPAVGQIWFDTTLNRVRYKDNTATIKSLDVGGVALVEADIPTLTTAGKVSGSAINTGTIGGNTIISTTGSVSSASSSTRIFDIYDSDNTNFVRLQTVATGSLTSNYTLTLPADDGLSGQFLTTDGAGVLTWSVPAAADHGTLTGLADDDHLQYTMNAGRAGGQILRGGTASGDDITMESTSDATKGFVILQPNGGNVGIGTTTPTVPLEITAPSGAGMKLVATGPSSELWPQVISEDGSGNALIMTYGTKGGLTYGWDGHAFVGSQSNHHFAIRTNNQARISIDPTGNVGVGTTGPLAQFHIQTSADASVGQIITGTAGQTADFLQFQKGADTRAVVDLGGSFRTKGRFQLLENDGTTVIQSLYQESDLLYIRAGPTANRTIMKASDVSTIAAFDGATHGMSVGSSYGGTFSPNGLVVEGNVGIGTTSPTAVLHLKAGTVDPNTAPLKFNSGVLLGAVENGAFEYNGSEYFVTAGGVRRAIATQTTGGALNSVTSITGIGALPISAGGASNNLTLSATGTGEVISTSVTHVTNATASTGTTSGALVVDGGLGIAGAAHIGASLTVPFIYGSSASGGDLTIDSTSHATKGDIILAPGTTGNVGIGTASPSTKLHINNEVIDDAARVYDTKALMVVHQTPTATATLNDPEEVLYLARQGTSGQAYGAMATLKLSRFENNATNSRTRLDFDLTHGAFTDQNVMTLLSSGNVGVGTTNPTQKFHVSGSAPKIFLEHTGGNDLELGWDGAGLPGMKTTGGALSLQESGDIVLARASGNVGIGTTSPLALLHVDGGAILGPANTTFAGDPNFIIGDSNTMTNSGGGNANNMFLIGRDNAVTTSLFNFNYHLYLLGRSNTVTSNAGNSVVIGKSNNVSAAGTYTFGDGITNNVAGAMMLGVSESAKMTVLSSGNVGIGTTGPSAKLDIFDGDLILSKSGDGLNVGVSLISYGANNDPLISGIAYNGTRALPTATSGGDPLLRLIGNGYDGAGTGRGQITINAAEAFTGLAHGTDIRFTTTATGTVVESEKVRIASNGNVGIGTTSPYADLVVDRSGEVTGIAARSIGTVGFTPDAFMETTVYRNGNANSYTGYYSYHTAGAPGAVTPLPADSWAGALVFKANYATAASATWQTFAAVDAKTGTNFSAADREGLLVFSTSDGNGSNGATERMRIDNVGNVGIGTPGPGEKLTVVGTVHSTSGGIRFPDSTLQASESAAPMLTWPLTTVPISSTRYAAFGKYNVMDAAEAAAQLPSPGVGTLKVLQCHTTTAQPGTGSLRVRLRVNGADTALTFNIVNGSAAGTFSDSVNTVTVGQGNLINLSLVNSSGAAVSASVQSCSILFSQ